MNDTKAKPKPVFKKHTVWYFTGPNNESWWGDCPKWAESLKKARPELTVKVGMAIGQRARCVPCEEGWPH